MRIAHLNSVYETGSTGRLIRDLIRAAQAHGHEARCWYAESHSDAPEATRYLSDTERKLHALESRVSGLQGYWSAAATRRLLREWDEFAPDVVHLHGVHGNCVHLPLLFDWLHQHQPRVVLTLHDCWWFTGRCVHPTVYDCEKYTKNCENCPANRDVCPSWFFDRADKMLADKRRWLLGLNDLTVVAVSDWLAGQAKQSFLPEGCVVTVHNWVDTAVFAPPPPQAQAEARALLGLAEGERLALAVAGIWYADKGLPELFTLAETLPAPWRLALVGTLPEGCTLPPRLLHLPRTDSTARLAALYAAADVLVNASHAETFGLTTAEAMACGTPAVVFDRTACPEVLAPGCGTAVPFEQGREGLLAAILAQQKDPARCRAHVCAAFDKTVQTERYLNLYRRERP